MILNFVHVFDTSICLWLTLQVLDSSVFSFSAVVWLTELFLADVRVPKQDCVVILWPNNFLAIINYSSIVVETYLL